MTAVRQREQPSTVRTESNARGSLRNGAHTPAVPASDNSKGIQEKKNMPTDKIKQSNWFKTAYRITDDDIECYFYLDKTEHCMSLSRIKRLRDDLNELILAAEDETLDAYI
jgi:hypothetical protein